jgi:dihydrofolate reductase
MGKLVVSEFVSLDGVMEDPGGAEDYAHGGWTFTFDRGDDGDRFKLEELQDADILLLGRRTYEGFARAWPSMTDEAGFAEKMNGMSKVVVSSTLESADWNNSEILRGDLAAGVAELKTRSDGNILVAGSAQLVHGLMQHDLVDELRLMLFPIVLGSGKRMYPDSESASRLELVESRPVGSDGVLVLTYRRAAG